MEPLPPPLAFWCLLCCKRLGGLLKFYEREAA